MTTRKLASAFVALVLTAFGALVLTSPAQAATVDGWTTNTGTIVRTVAGTNLLVMDQKFTTAGTSLEKIVTGNVHQELVVKFTFKLAGADATCGGGAPRVYLLGGALYGQIMTCPAAEAGDWQTVDLTSDPSVTWWSGSTQHATWAAAVAAHQGTPLGQVGLVFDNAAGKDARAYYRGLTLAGESVNLGKPVRPTRPTPPKSASPSPSASPTPTAGAVHPTTTAVPGVGGGLPVTGAGAGGVAGAAAVLLAIGAALFLVARRRRVTFTT